MDGNVELFSIRELVAKGISRMRSPLWANPLDHLQLDVYPIREGTWLMGPWLHLYCPINVPINGRDPVDMLVSQPGIDLDAKGMVEYTGPHADSEEYIKARDAAVLDWKRVNGTPSIVG